MRAAFSVLGLLIVLAIVWLVIRAQVSPQGVTGGKPPVQTIDVVGVKNQLLALAQAERMYLASHGSYASIEALQQDGSVTFSGSTSRGYSYSADVDDGQHFKITAAPADASKADWPTLSIDETMQVTQ